MDGWGTATLPRRFEDRTDAGRQLAQRLIRYREEDPIVLALPRGGVAIGLEIARSLGAPLDLFIARKLGAPGQPELGIGALAPGGIIVVDEWTIRMLGISPAQLQRVAQAEQVELERRMHRYRGDRRPPDLRGRTVILVDDGLATGMTARAAVVAIREQYPRRLVLAVPVCSGEAAAALEQEVDEVVCLMVPADFMAVGLWYRDFEQMTDEEVVALLEAAQAFAPQQSASTASTNHAPTNSPAGAGGGATDEQMVRIPVGEAALEGNLAIPEGAKGLVLFAHGSGSSRNSPRNRYVAEQLGRAGLATLLVDLLTAAEEAVDLRTRHLRFDIGLLAKRLVGITDALAHQEATRGLAVGLFGASTGAGAALVAAAERPETVRAIVSRGGRPDLAADALLRVRAPTLLMVGGYDAPVIELNEKALDRLAAPVKELVIVPGASHLFEEPGTLEEVARLATEWFARYLIREG